MVENLKSSWFLAEIKTKLALIELGVKGREILLLFMFVYTFAKTIVRHCILYAFLTTVFSGPLYVR